MTGVAPSTLGLASCGVRAGVAFMEGKLTIVKSHEKGEGHGKCAQSPPTVRAGVENSPIKTTACRFICQTIKKSDLTSEFDLYNPLILLYELVSQRK
ncbi:hypothetical protein ABENE_10115 [Asticcacaulis benevestitus DSM 16100 = ATCC BAA-896]|uniref:Uncharacterized protein n=1 Tax=Asticcacaulis benevestitus DSM 16100 = ATCC BAA-896 TaxID=1121022 RepID=V4PTN2_9CAUL|nr:hypothetical protein ABENE_10115 [Asticcacaulis benevestitus DSM 16100 = ATCC BAA-896]